jgi:thymidine phosphorylase
LITDMSQPLVPSAGNAVEVAVVMETLRGDPVHRALWDLTLALGGEALALGGIVADAGAGAQKVETALTSGAAAQVFGRMVAAQGGPADFVENWQRRLPVAPVRVDVPCPQDGQVAAINAQTLGLAVVALGGGRQRDGDAVDLSVGLSGLAGLGQAVARGGVLATVHARDDAGAQRAAAAVLSAYRVSDAAPPAAPLVLERIT